MITYAERVCFDPLHLRTLKRVEACVARIADTWGNDLRCHELARAVQRVLELGAAQRARARPWVRASSNSDEVVPVVVDGKCGPVEHSWLRFSDGVIIDPYVPGRLPAVQIVDPIVGTAYRPGPDRDDIQQAIVDQLVLEMHDSVS